MFRRFALLGFMLLLAVAVRPASGDERLQAIMRTKLSNTQSLLKAIVTTDYKEIDRAADALRSINEMEIVSWQTSPKREYTRQAMLFMTAVDDLRDASSATISKGSAPRTRRWSPPASTAMRSCATPAPCR